MELTIDGMPLEVATIEEGATVELACLPPSTTLLRLEVAGVALEPFLRPGDPIWRWRWMAPLAAGRYPWHLRAESPDLPPQELRGHLLVIPRKLDTERYHLLLNDLQACEPLLLQALDGGLNPAASERPQSLQSPTDAEELALLTGSVLERFGAAALRLAQRPPDRLRSTSHLTPPDRMRDPARLDLRRLDPPAESASPREILAASGPLPEQRRSPTYDSYEQRLLVRLLDGLLRRTRMLLQRDDLPAAAHEQVTDLHVRLRGLRNMPFLAEVPPLDAFRGPTTRLQRDADWRAVYRTWQEVRRRPLIAWDTPTTQLGVSDLPRLYERWCALQLCLALLKLPGRQLESQALAEASGGLEWRFALHDRAPLLVLAGEQGQLRVYYQARYKPISTTPAPLVALDRHTRVPDLAIEWRQPNLPPRLIILDAKYRLDARGGVPADAMADAYSYLGGIGYPGGERAVLAVALLYPGSGAPAIHPSGVAALPLLPGNVETLHHWLNLQF